MTSTETPAPAAEEQDAPKGWDTFDTLGVIAGVLLVAIVADILTDGRLISRRLRPRPAPAEEVPGE